jgi:hypothetical protein
MNDLTTGRLRRELRTIEAMLVLYCRAHHPGAQPQSGPGAGPTARQRLCRDCAELGRYAHARLANCPFGPEKPTCANCKVHCYRPEPREQIKAVMRFAGPRLLLRHPVLTLLHLWVDERRAAPEKPPRRRPSAQPA